jgi:signal peptidase
VLWSAIGLVLGAMLAAAGPLAIGDRPYVVRSGSMAPTIDTGDIVVTKPISPLHAQVGDIVTFRDPIHHGRLLCHRVRSVHRAGRHVSFITQGDANSARERWKVQADGRIGVVLYRLPKLGYALSWTGTRAGQMGLIAVPAVLLCWSILGRIWGFGRRRRSVCEPLG